MTDTKKIITLALSEEDALLLSQIIKTAPLQGNSESLLPIINRLTRVRETILEQVMKNKDGQKGDEKPVPSVPAAAAPAVKKSRKRN